MKKDIKIILLLILFVSSFLLFNVAEFEPLNRVINKYFQSFIFSTILVISVFRPSLRVKFFYLGFLFMFFAGLFYLLSQVALSNSFASIGIGIIFIVSLTYLPQIIKKGFVEKL